MLLSIASSLILWAVIFFNSSRIAERTRFESNAWTIFRSSRDVISAMNLLIVPLLKLSLDKSDSFSDTLFKSSSRMLKDRTSAFSTFALWVPAAKKLLTYNGKDMDALAQRKRLKIVDKDLKLKNMSEHLLSWSQFLEFVAAEVDAYNSRSHSSLPKIIDQGGHKRHMTPAERWVAFVCEGWRPDTLNEEEMRDLFRPQIECTTNRGLVKVFTNEYFNTELEHHNGERVFVNYDIHDPNIVWVRDRQQRMICEARWNGNRRHYFPLAVVEQARQQRKDRRIGLKQRQIREIEEEAMGMIEMIPEECVKAMKCEMLNVNGEKDSHDPDRLNLGIGEEECVSGSSSTCAMPALGNQTEIERSESTHTFESDCRAASRPFFTDEVERYEWHLRNGFHTDDDLGFKVEFETTDNYRLLFETLSGKEV